MRERSVSLSECRRLIGPLPDADLGLICDTLLALAEIAVQAYVEWHQGNPTTTASEVLSPEETEDAEERAAIKEYDAGLSRPEAEREAVALILGKRPRR